MRTVIAALHEEVEAQLEALDAKRAGIARGYIRRLALQPYLGVPVARGPLAAYGVRRIYFDLDDVPEDLFRARQRAKRRGGEDLGEGPRWRVVYWIGCAPRAQTRVLVILAVAEAHPRGGRPTVYELAWTRLKAIRRRNR